MPQSLFFLAYIINFGDLITDSLTVGAFSSVEVLMTDFSNFWLVTARNSLQTAKHRVAGLSSVSRLRFVFHSPQSNLAKVHPSIPRIGAGCAQLACSRKDLEERRHFFCSITFQSLLLTQASVDARFQRLLLRRANECLMQPKNSYLDDIRCQRRPGATGFVLELNLG